MDMTLKNMLKIGAIGIAVVVLGNAAYDGISVVTKRMKGKTVEVSPPRVVVRAAPRRRSAARRRTTAAKA